MTVIDLGEPGRYEPGDAPMLRRYRLLPPQRRGKAVVVAALVAAAGAFAGIGPAAADDPQLHHVGRIRGPFTQVYADTVVSYDDQQAEITAYALDGSGPRWRLPAAQPPTDITVVEPLVIITFVGLSYLESTTNAQTDLPARVVAVDAATGQLRWSVVGSPVSPLSGPIAAVGTGKVGAERIEGVDTKTGRTLWDQPLNGYPLSRSASDERSLRTDEIIVLAPDGAVQIMSIATGVTRPAGHVVAGAEALFEWRGLLAVRRTGPGEGQAEFLVYRLGTGQPLWHRTVASNAPGYAPCCDHICSYDSAGYDRLDPLTGRLVAAFNPDAPDPYVRAADPWWDWRGATGLGEWEPIGMYAGQALVRLDPSFAQDKQTWLGEATLRGRVITVRPLMGIGPRANSCTVGPQWLFCDGSAVEDAVSVRLSELDSLLVPQARSADFSRSG
jgi:outer membrane protein assembly factor BamB